MPLVWSLSGTPDLVTPSIMYNKEPRDTAAVPNPSKGGNGIKKWTYEAFQSKVQMKSCNWLKSGNIFEPEIKLLLSELEDEKATVV